MEKHESERLFIEAAKDLPLGQMIEYKRGGYAEIAENTLFFKSLQFACDLVDDGAPFEEVSALLAQDFQKIHLSNQQKTKKVKK
jgi:hypothetical protein